MNPFIACLVLPGFALCFAVSTKPQIDVRIKLTQKLEIVLADRSVLVCYVTGSAMADRNKYRTRMTTVHLLRCHPKLLLQG